MATETSGTVQSNRRSRYNEEGGIELYYVLTGTHQTGIIWSAQYYTNYGFVFDDSYLDQRWINMGDNLYYG